VIGTLQTIVGVVIHIFFFFMYMLVLRVGFFFIFFFSLVLVLRSIPGLKYPSANVKRTLTHDAVHASEFSCRCHRSSANDDVSQRLWTMQPAHHTHSRHTVEGTMYPEVPRPSPQFLLDNMWITVSSGTLGFSFTFSPVI
jgi:hypothetical protein